MRVERFEWEGATATAIRIRGWRSALPESPDVGKIFQQVVKGGDQAVLALTNLHDATERGRESLEVDPGLAANALEGLDPVLREAFDLAAANIRAVAEAQLGDPARVELPEGQIVTVREVALGAAGIYAPGGRAAYPSSVLMCAIPARVAGVERLALASPPGPDGELSDLILAAAALCEVDEIYAMGGAQAIFALAYGTEAIESVDVVAGPGNAWVREAKRAVSGVVRIRLARRTLGADGAPRPRHRSRVGRARPLCAGGARADSPLLAVAVEAEVLDALEAATLSAAAERPGVQDAPLALVQVPDLSDGIDLANAFAPEHLQLMEEHAALLADRVTTAGCVFAGRHAATAFGDIRGRLEPRPADRRRRPLLGPARPGCLPPQDRHRGGSRRGGGEACPTGRRHRPRRGIPGARRVSDD